MSSGPTTWTIGRTTAGSTPTIVMSANATHLRLGRSAPDPVHDAGITVFHDDAKSSDGRTDTGGQRALLLRGQSTRGWSQSQAREFRVVAEKGFVAQSQTFLPQQRSTLDTHTGQAAARPGRPTSTCSSWSTPPAPWTTKSTSSSASMADIADETGPSAGDARCSLWSGCLSRSGRRLRRSRTTISP